MMCTAVNSATDSVRIGRSSTGFDYCLIAWGGQAAIVGLVGIALFPTDSYSLVWLPVTLSYGLSNLRVVIAAWIDPEVSDSSCA